MKISELESFIQSRPGPTVINFWATWCVPCIEEMPWFNKIVHQNKNGDNHQRSIAAQVLSGLAKSDPEKRMVKDVEEILKVTHDERFVTARHALQSLWKIAIVSPELLGIVTNRLNDRYKDALSEKNGTLVRSDIIEVFKKIYDKTQDEKVKHQALLLIEKEEDPKYRKKYLGFWKE